MKLNAPKTIEEFMAQAYAMEVERRSRYADLADAMDTHNNREVAELFRKMAVIEGKARHRDHAAHGLEDAAGQCGGAVVGGLRGGANPCDRRGALPDAAVARAAAGAGAEQRAERFFAELAKSTTDESVRKAALELQEEEREHVELSARLDGQACRSPRRLGGRPGSAALRPVARDVQTLLPPAGRRRSATPTASPPTPVAWCSSPGRSAGNARQQFERTDFVSQFDQALAQRARGARAGGRPSRARLPHHRLLL